jgi:CRP-like cAMP-binding protein
LLDPLDGQAFRDCGAETSGKRTMSKPHERERVNNRILLALPAATLKLLRPALELLDMAKGQMIDHVDGPIRYMYFINRGLVSLVKRMKDGRAVEVGVVGIEGVTDPNALFGMEIAIIEAVVQIPGTAFRIRREQLALVMAGDHTLHGIMQKYMRFAFGQLAQTAGCNRLHSLEERCCRWLLICQDNALSDSFPIAHEIPRDHARRSTLRRFDYGELSAEGRADPVCARPRDCLESRRARRRGLRMLRVDTRRTRSLIRNTQKGIARVLAETAQFLAIYVRNQTDRGVTDAEFGSLSGEGRVANDRIRDRAYIISPTASFSA